MLPLGFIIFPLLIHLLHKINNKVSIVNYFFNGFAYGFGLLIILLSWIHNPFLVYESTKDFAFLAILLPLFLSLFFGLGFCFYKYVKSYVLILSLTPFVFIFIEIIISNIIYGFPWITLSLILSNNFIGFYILKYFGIYVSSYLSVFFFTLPLFFFLNTTFFLKNILIIILHLPFLLSLIFFSIFFKSNESNFSKEISLDIYQIVSPIKNINRDQVEKNIIKNIQNSDSEFIIFAENNYPYIVSDDNISNLTKYINNNKKVIIGATRFDNNKFYNSFLLLEEDNVKYFDKKILVPFGEFLPFRKYLKFMETVAGGTDYYPGEIDRLITTNKGINLLPIICYEIIFNKILDNINKNKIDFLVNITNDSWFGKKVGPYQHFYLTRLRSLISNKPIVRVSNNGISAIIDENGKIINFSKLNEKTNIKHKLKIKNKTYYNLIHNVFLIYLTFVFLIILIFNNYKSNDK